MKSSLLLSLALFLAPAAAFAQAGPPPPPDATDGAHAPPTAAQMAAMQQMRAQMEQMHVQVRSQMLGSLTAQHRTAVASIVGQLALSANPDPAGAARQLDLILSPGEKQSVLNVAANAHNTMHAMMEQHRAQMESTMTADQRTQMAAREAKMQAFRQSHPRPEMNDPGTIVLHTLGAFGGPEGMHGHGF
jgi:hypothetical protein